jgi:hypothetical protein
MKRTLVLKRNRDGTVTLRCPETRYVEHIDIANKGFVEAYESIKFAAITAGFHPTQDDLMELFREGKGLI